MDNSEPYIDSDDFATSATNIFSNEKPSDEIKEEIQAEQDEADAIAAHAQANIDWIESEMQNLVDIRDFVESLAAMPTDVEARKLATKLELRYALFNQLETQRQHLVDRAEQANVTVHTTDIRPAPKYDPIRIVIEKKVPITSVVIQRPYGFKAIAQGIADIFKRRKPMQ